MQNIRDLGA